MDKDVMHLAKLVLNCIVTVNFNNEMKAFLADGQLLALQTDLHRVFDRLVREHQKSTYEFCSLWRAMILKFIKSDSLKEQLFGWEQIEQLIGACTENHPPPRSHIATGAGCSFCNGKYEFAGSITADG